MIQRIQTLFLILIIILSIFFISGDLLTFTNSGGEVVNIKLPGVENESLALVTAGIFITNILVIASTLIITLSITAIFVFKKRKLQHFLTMIVAFLALSQTVAEAYMIYTFLRLPETNIIPGFRLLIPLVIIILALLAARGIKRDERLVRYYERLR